MGDARRRRAGAQRVDLGRMGDARDHRDRRAVGREREVVARRGVREAVVLAVERDGFQKDARLVRQRDDQALRVAAPEDGAGIVAEVHHGDVAGLAVLDLELPQIGLVAVARLRGPGEVAAVGRRTRLRVVAGVGGGEVLRLAGVAVDEEEIAVGAPRLVRRGLAVDDQLARGRERVTLGAKTEAGPVGVEGRHVARRAARRRLHEEVRALAVFPLVPVAGEEVLDQPRLGGRHRCSALRGFATGGAGSFPLLRSLLVAGVVGAVGVDVAGEGDPAAVGREDAAVGAGGDGGELARVAAGERVEPELAAAHHQQQLAVRRPAPMLRLAVAGELARLTSGQGQEPDVLHVAVFGEALLAHRHRRPLAVGRDLDVVRAAGLKQFLGSERSHREQEGHQQGVHGPRCVSRPPPRERTHASVTLVRPGA